MSLVERMNFPFDNQLQCRVMLLLLAVSKGPHFQRVAEAVGVHDSLLEHKRAHRQYIRDGTIRLVIYERLCHLLLVKEYLASFNENLSVKKFLFVGLVGPGCNEPKVEPL